MPARKVTSLSSRRTQSSTTSDVDSTGILPTILYEYLTNPPRNDKNGNRPAKRQKLEADLTLDSFDSIVVGRSTIEVEFSKSRIVGNISVQRTQLPIQLNPITRSAEDLRLRSLEIIDRSTSKRTSLLHVPIKRVNGLTENATLAFLVSSDQYHPSNPDGQGRLWLDTRLELYEKNGYDCLKIDLAVKWNITTSLEYLEQKLTRRPSLDVILSTYFPNPSKIEIESKSWSPQDYYQSVHVPDKSDAVALTIETKDLDSQLFPFQKRAVQWLLNREGMCWSGVSRRIEPVAVAQQQQSSFTRVVDHDGQPCYVSHLLRIVTRDTKPFLEAENALKGGILSEEMGLGKTVEMIALITLNRMKEITETNSDLIAESLKRTAATLIITPPSILPQWISELKNHAPNLKVFHYMGLNSHELSENEFLDNMINHDVVLTTYNVLASELHYTLPPPDRQLRNQPRYPRPTSPLKQLSWWRVCLDEAQMIESGVSNAAIVARLIPRINAWGITGTPVRRDVNDLLGLLIFLNYEPYASLKHIWKQLITNHRPIFRQLFQNIAMRHTKRAVRDELRLPPQSRYTLTLPFTAIEEQYYQQLHERMAADCGLDNAGAPLHGEWDPQDPRVLETMRTWLDDLRMCALNPGASIYGKRTAGRKQGPLRTVEEVLQAMMEQSDLNIRTDHRNLLLLRLRRGQMLENGPRVREALQVWTETLEESISIVDECRQQLQEELDTIHAQNSEKAGKEVAKTVVDSDESDEEGDENSETSRLGLLKLRLRSALMVQHVATFFQSNAYFQIKSNEEWTKPESDEFKELEKLEVEGYERAKTVRREILAEASRKAQRLIRKLERKAQSQYFVEIPEFPSNPPKGGIESRGILERLDALAQVLDAQANQLDEWREATIRLLIKPLVDEDEDLEITGDEYEDSTKVQDEVMVYVQALRALIADRHDALTGQVNMRIKEEMKSSLRFAKDGVGAFPEKTIELLTIREKLKPALAMGSIRGITSDLRSLATALRMNSENGSSRAEAELTMVEQERDRLQKQVTDQMKAVQSLEKELDLFTTLMNARIEYYRQFQEVSDTVAPYEGPTTDNALEQTIKNERDLENKLASSRSKKRYLLHLQDETDAKDTRICVICTSEFVVGALTVCGHQFCKDCISLWWAAHRNCPVCKKVLTQHDLHDITYKPRQMQVQVEEPLHHPDRDSPSSKKHTGIYSSISSNTLAEINNVPLDGPSFTTKIDTLVRHLLWLREKDPGVKSIIFSQYSDFLHILSRAFQQYRIGFTSITSTNGIEKFKRDPSVECFLLHARAHSSGLNLVNASHVFLCEPLINTALELQAIARVDRIGQQQATTVWLYLIDGTVEEAIHNISVRRRMEHIGIQKAARAKESTPELPASTLDAANSLEMQEASLSKLMSRKLRGEAVDDKDLWECLFGSVKRRDPVRSKLLDREVRRHAAAEAAEARAANAGSAS